MVCSLRQTQATFLAATILQPYSLAVTAFYISRRAFALECQVMLSAKSAVVFLLSCISVVFWCILGFVPFLFFVSVTVFYLRLWQVRGYSGMFVLSVIAALGIPIYDSCDV